MAYRNMTSEAITTTTTTPEPPRADEEKGNYTILSDYSESWIVMEAIKYYWEIECKQKKWNITYNLNSGVNKLKKLSKENANVGRKVLM